jgi:hypothetical protein
VLGLASLFVQFGAERLMQRASRAPDVVGPASPDATVTPPRGTVAWVVFEVVEPGVLFFLGCLVVVGAVALLRAR